MKVARKCLFNSGAVGSDRLNPMMIKHNLDLISNQVLLIFNISFAQGVFPKLLKTAIVTPIYKSGSHNDPSNYRPISILTIFSKVLEKLFYNRLLSFINSQNLLHDNQFRFRASAITNVLSNLIDKCNSKTHFIFIFCFQSAAPAIWNKLPNNVTMNSSRYTLIKKIDEFYNSKI